MRTHATMLAALAVNCSLTLSAIAQDKPNLIFILTDDQGLDAIQWPPDTRGSEWVRTPTLNALAVQGVSFTNFRVNPNCSPTRAALMTGRSACDTGVNGVLSRYRTTIQQRMNPCEGAEPLGYPEAQITNRLALQNHERTIAEVLQKVGYYTILVDKWHLGYNEDGEDLGLLPHQQGFDEFFDWKEIICDGYAQREFFADRHMLDMVDNALDAVGRRGNKPYALFFHTITPHRRHHDIPGTPPSGYQWWAIEDPSLIPDTYRLEVNSRNRFLQNIEALDTVLGQYLLSQPPIEAIDPQTLLYNEERNTIIFFLADNGTDGTVSFYGTTRAKNSTFEGGIKVPMFVMGEGVPGNTQSPVENTRLVSHVDFFDTICDIIGATPTQRDNGDYGRFPRRSVTFADAIGWGDPPANPREYSLSSFGSYGSGDPIWRVALVGERYKLVCNADSNRGTSGVPSDVDLDDMLDDDFYDLWDDPQEANDLLENLPMTVDEVTAYLDMRDRVSDYWPMSVSVAYPAQPALFTVDHYMTFPTGQWYVLVAWIENDSGTMTYAGEEFFDLLADPNRYENLLEGQMTPFEEQVYNQLHAELYQMFLDGQAAPDLRVVDVQCNSFLIKTSDNNQVTAQLTLGHENVEDFGGDELEYRARLWFDFSNEFELPPGFAWGDLERAQIVVAFKHDSVKWDEAGYIDNDTDTGVITVHQMTAWTTDLFNQNHFAAAELGLFDPPPHAIANPPYEIRGLPMMTGQPISFGHSDALKSLVQGWAAATTPNYGVLFKVQRLGTEGFELPGDQHIHFLKHAVLRLTFEREGQ